MTDYEWEIDYTFMDYDESTVYFAQAGYIDFTGAEIALPEDPLPQSLNHTAKNNDVCWYSNLDTMRIYKEQVWDYDPVEIPEITPDLIFLYHDAELVWENDKITEIKTYYYYHDGYTYGYDDYDYYYYSEYYSDLSSIQMERFPYWKTEFIYDSSGNLERICSGAWDGESVDYSYVNVYSGYDESGNPVKETEYSGMEYPRGEGITQYPENIAVAEVTRIDFRSTEYWPSSEDYFVIYSPEKGYYVWYSGDSMIDPQPAFLTGIQVDLSEPPIEELTANAINAQDDFSASVLPDMGLIEITNAAPGNVYDAYAITYNSLDISVKTHGYPDVYISNYSYEYDESGRLVSAPYDEFFRFDVTYDDENSVKTLTFYDPENEGAYDVILTFNVPAGLLFDTDDLVEWIDPIGDMIIETLLPYYIMTFPPPEPEI